MSLSLHPPGTPQPAPLLAISATYQVVTPAWLGGADQQPELRTQSLKGLLRFWYRAVEPGYRTPLVGEGYLTPEDLLFGTMASGGDRKTSRRHGTAAPESGTGLFSLQSTAASLSEQKLAELSWSSVRAESYSSRQERNINGLVYLGFSLKMNAHRRALPAGYTFTLTCQLLPPTRTHARLDPGELRRARRGLLAALWLLGSIGSMGTRARRGFGALSLQSWEIRDLEQDWLPAGSLLASMPRRASDARDGLKQQLTEDLNSLPLLVGADSRQTWLTQLQQGLRTLERWFRPKKGVAETPPRPSSQPRHPHLSERFGLVLQLSSFRRWEECLADLGASFQRFRLKRAPDLGLLRAHWAFLEHKPEGRRISQAPERCVFGLPLTFRSGFGRRGQVQFVCFNRRANNPIDRHPSLLFLRPVRITSGQSRPEQFYALAFRLDGALPGKEPGVTLERSNERLSPPQEDLMERFLSELRGTRQ